MGGHGQKIGGDMNSVELINILAVAVLVGFIVALLYLIILLHRANRMLGRLENLSGTLHNFVAEIVPAIINVGTIATAMEAVLRRIHVNNHEDSRRSGAKSKVK